MFISDRIVFIELHKTGCTHIGHLLGQLLVGEQVLKHNRATPELFDGTKSFIGSIRNPWDWYVSLWAYGCDGQGAVQGSVTADRGPGENGAVANAERWRRSYQDVTDADGFRDWLAMINDDRYCRDVGEAYGKRPLDNHAGLMTHRYVNLFCLGDGMQVGTAEQLKAFERQHCYIDQFIRNETLESDLLQALARSGVAVTESMKAVVHGAGRTNTSSRTRPASFYYDEATLQLVARREQFIIEKFGYLGPAD